MLPLFLFIFTFTEHTYNIFYTTRRVPLFIFSLLPLGRGPVGCRTEIRTRACKQQADALLSEPRRTRIHILYLFEEVVPHIPDPF
jgi:hypothetical protein